MSDLESLDGGRYLLVKRLGEGGMATVYRAFDQRLQVWRAVKVLLPEYAKRPKILGRFEIEAQTMARLEHPNIVRVYDVVMTDPEHPFIVMELIEGGSLVDWLEQHGPMPARLAIDVVVASCQALQVAHDNGVIHRDIKPHNLMVDRDGVVRLTDFGIAQAAEADGVGKNLTRTGAVMGTLGYMAPEQKTDAKHLTPAADVYAMAATLYSLLTDRTPMDLFAAEKDASLLEGIPDILAPVLVKATEYKPDLRYGSARELAAALLAVRDSLPPDPPHTPSLRRPVDATPPPPNTRTGYTSASRSGSVPAMPAIQSRVGGPTPPPSQRTPAPPGGETLLPDDAERSGSNMTMPPDDRAGLEPASQQRKVFVPPPAAEHRSGGGSSVAVLVALLALFLAVGILAAVVLTRQPSTVVIQPAPAPTPTPVEPAPVLVAPAPAPDATPVTPAPVTPAPVTPAPVTPGTPPRPRPGTPGTPTPPTQVDPSPGTPPITPRVTDDLLRENPPATPPPAQVAQCISSVTVPAEGKIGSPVPYRVKTCREGEVVLHYRPVGAGTWYSKALRLALGSYSTTVNVDASFAQGVEWYLTSGEASYGSESSPKVTPVSAPAN